MRDPHGGRSGRPDRTLPETTISIRSGGTLRCIRLTARAKLAAITVAAGFVTWSAVATGMLAIEALNRIDEQGAIDQIAEAYERRLAAITAERDAILARRAGAEARSEAALATLAARHDAVAAAVASEKALSASVESLRLRVATLTAERDALIETAAVSSSRLAEIETALAMAERERRDLVETLQKVAHRLDLTADARDGAMAVAVRAEDAVGVLEADIEQQRDVQTRLLEQIEAAAARSIGPLEQMLGAVGLDVETLLQGMRRSDSGRGGPFVPVEATLAALPAETSQQVTGVLGSLERIALLRQAAQHLPFGAPVRNLRVSSAFGPRRDPFNRRAAFHEGVDFPGPVGTPIYAPADGVVTFAGTQSGYGRLVKIRHEFGFETVYAHLNRARVRVGDRVTRGQRIADKGNTGRSTGPHLHYEIRLRGRPLDPMTFIEAARNVL